MEDLNDILKLSGMKTKTVKKNLNESVEVEEAYTNEPDETYASVDAILQQGTDLNRPKTQHAVGGFTGDNPMTEGGADVDEDAVRELKIYIDHNADLYKQNVEPIQRNLSRKWDKGVYDHELAQKLFYYLAVNGAKQYGQEHSNGDGLRIFSPDTRRAVAKELADDWLAELKAGNKMDEAEIDLEEMLADILISEAPKKFQLPKGFPNKLPGSDDKVVPMPVRPGDKFDVKPMPVEPKRPKFGKNEPEYVTPLEEKDSTKRLSDKEIWDQTPAKKVSDAMVKGGKFVKGVVDKVKDAITGND